MPRNKWHENQSNTGCIKPWKSCSYMEMLEGSWRAAWRKIWSRERAATNSLSTALIESLSYTEKLTDLTSLRWQSAKGHAHEMRGWSRLPDWWERLPSINSQGYRQKPLCLWGSAQRHLSSFLDNRMSTIPLGGAAVKDTLLSNKTGFSLSLFLTQTKGQLITSTGVIRKTERTSLLSD